MTLTFLKKKLRVTKVRQLAQGQITKRRNVYILNGSKFDLKVLLFYNASLKSIFIL